uniref:Alpha-lactalbumin n=1 Tax=Bos mutus grunniens TaxID=30521 RepID=A0A8B9W833_BOSMU
MPGPLRLFPQIKGGILFHATQAEQLTKCEVFRELKDLKGYGGVSLPEWVCTTFHTSGYDTQAIVQNNDSTEYGLFQINNKIWCKDDQNPHSSNICNISCDKFLDDDLTDDIMCVSLPEWVCTTFHTSGYDTQAIVQNNDSTEYGLFQINNKIWCKDDQNPHSSNICNISCDKFLDDDLTDDIMCVKKILDKVGINYWLVHKALCSEKLDQWLCEKL